MGRSRVHSATPGGSSTTEGRGNRAMKPWDVLRREAAGLRRSIRYDLVRRAEAQRALAARRPTEVLDADRPRRAFTVTGVSLVLAGGAAGTYLAVAGGGGPLCAAAAGPPPPARRPPERPRHQRSTEPAAGGDDDPVAESVAQRVDVVEPVALRRRHR